MNPSNKKNDEEEEEEEQLIDPNDLIIINDPKNWEPKQDQIYAYAEQLGIDVHSDPKELLEIACKYLKIDLPSDWKRSFRKDNNQLLYINFKTNDIRLSTDIEEKAKDEVLKFHEEYKNKGEKENKKKEIQKFNEINQRFNIELKNKNKTEKKPTDIPSKYLPPLTPNVKNLKNIILINKINQSNFDNENNNDINDKNEIEQIKILKNENDKLNKIIVDLKNKIKQLSVNNSELNEKVKKYKELEKKNEELEQELKKNYSI